MRFRDFDQSILASDNLNRILENAGILQSEFLLKIQNYAYAAIGQGHNWPEGFFGLVPLLNLKDFKVYYFSTKLPFKLAPNDDRLKEDLILLVIIVKDKVVKLFNNQETLEHILKTFFDKNINYSEEINDTTLRLLKKEIYYYLKKRLNNMVL